LLDIVRSRAVYVSASDHGEILTALDMLWNIMFELDEDDCVR